MKNKKKGLLQIILILAIIGLCGFTTLVGFTKHHKGSAQNIKLGLDLAGGVSITYEAVGDTPSQTEMEDTRNMMQKRAEVYSTESSVVIGDGGRITIDIPGVANADEVLASLGKEGSLDFVAQDDMSFEDNDQTKPKYTKTVCTGKDVKTAEATTQQNEVTKKKEYVVSLKFKSKGTKSFANATAAAAPSKKVIYIVYDGKVISFPAVQSEISNGEAVISGSFKTYDSAEELASMIRIGALPVELKEVQSQVVGAQLGQDAIQSSLLAGAIGFALVVLFMIVFYRLPGLAASIALVFYLVVMLVGLNALDITLTLPGVAGIILNIGMAVDANVIIYARIEEEIGAGKTVHAAIRDGFKKAASAILDGNVTTLIAAAVLYALASGSVRGFAMTLALGIVLSMFSAMVVSRLLVNSLYGMGLKDAKYYGTKKERKGFPFVEKRKIFFTISCILLLAVPASMIFMHQTKGSALNFGLDFKGGTSINVPFNEDYSIEELDKEVEPVVEGVTKDSNIQMTKVVGGNNVIIKTRSLTLEEREQVYQAMADNFGVDTSEITFDNISSTVSKEMSQNAMKAVIIAVVCMLLYIWIRFRDIRFASSAILALMHDIAIVFGFYVVSRISVGSTFIACMLTILGYSINSTIVIFDRIRENLPELKREPIESLVDRCITDTLTRSIYSSLTTFITIFVLFVMGVSSIRDFAAPLMVGIVCGAYTSVCITGALWYVMKHVGKNKYVPSKAVQNKTKNK